MSVRAAFADKFGEDHAAAIEAAANEHENDVHPNRGSDPFKWALLIAIGYECLSRFRSDHGITADTDEMRAWCVEHADLGSHDGDCDYLALFAGMYESWVPAEVTS